MISLYSFMSHPTSFTLPSFILSSAFLIPFPSFSTCASLLSHSHPSSFLPLPLLLLPLYSFTSFITPSLLPSFPPSLLPSLPPSFLPSLPPFPLELHVQLVCANYIPSVWLVESCVVALLPLLPLLPLCWCSTWRFDDWCGGECQLVCSPLESLQRGEIEFIDCHGDLMQLL